MSDEACFHIFMNHPDWIEPVSDVATSAKAVAEVIGQVLKEHYTSENASGLVIEVIYGVPVEVSVKQKDVAVVQVGDAKFLIGDDYEAK